VLEGRELPTQRGRGATRSEEKQEKALANLGTVCVPHTQDQKGGGVLGRKKKVGKDLSDSFSEILF